jgi:hypothetical protein
VIRMVTAVLRWAGKPAAGIAPAALVVRLGLPALGALVFLAAGTTRWLLGSDARAERVSRVLLAWRGNSGCLTSGNTSDRLHRLRGCAAGPGPGRAGYQR